MNKNLEQELIIKYPKLFIDMYGDPKKTCLFWGIECEIGWFELLKETCEKIYTIDRSAKFLQIKEKFGGLRIYIETCIDEVYDIIDAAEKESYNICEYCGNKENITSEGSWIKTLCKKCRCNNG